MLGGFSVTIGELRISDTDTRTKQVWHLLQYLISSRNQTVSQEDIIKVMWPEDDIENPTNALKNLIYRIRVMFREREVPFYKDIIIYNRGVYQWNNEIPTIVDVEEFEKHCKKAADTTLDVDVRLEEYSAALQYYKGDFLPGSSAENWVVPISSYLRTLFFKTLYAKLDILESLDQPDSYERVVVLCREALIKEPLEELLHYYLIKALYKQNRQKDAIAHYQSVSEQFYRELGIGPSDELKELFTEITKSVQNIEPDIKTIQDDLREGNEVSGAFYCDYEIFKNLYRLEARTAARTGTSMFVCLITAEGLENEDKRTQNKVMDSLQQSIQGNLRKGDVFSRFSATQFVLLLPTVTYANCEMVINRLLDKFDKTYRGKPMKIRAKILPLEPVE